MLYTLDLSKSSSNLYESYNTIQRRIVTEVIKLSNISLLKGIPIKKISVNYNLYEILIDSNWVSNTGSKIMLRNMLIELDVNQDKNIALFHINKLEHRNKIIDSILKNKDYKYDPITLEIIGYNF